MKTKLFSGQSVLISAKGIVSNFLTMLSAIPLWAISYYLIKKQLVILGAIFGLATIVWYLFFWGWVSNNLWKWR